MVDRNSRIVVTGGAGFLGRYVVGKLKDKGYRNIFIPRSKQYDLRKQSDCKKIASKADVIIHLAANVGGIGYNQKFPATLFYDNLLMGINLIHQSCKAYNIKFVAVGTVCAYPKYTPVPFKEESLWDGYPEETNAPYGLAKKMLLVASQSYRKQYNFNCIYLIPVNLYGPGDNFNPEKSHVIPALIRKIYTAKVKKERYVTVWGTGKASREFLFVEDAAEAIVAAMEKYNKQEPVNLGYGQDISISELVSKISGIIKYRGQTLWDKTKPDGQPRRLLNVDKAYTEFGFRAKTDFDTGLRKTINWYIKKYGK
ncbi:GDP-L-fucose synthase [Candidatus Gottesmanbacteria bacterium]|nr:GDP-L-fucose synthase [Candidatus Gottesmanbacteria bacterium]